MKVAVTGSHGLIGSELSKALLQAGHEVVPVVRRAPRAGEAGWNPTNGEIDLKALAGIQAVVHLAGASIAAPRWSDTQKNEILKSREDPTLLLARSLTKLDPVPSVLISGSATGFYGDRGDEHLKESSVSGVGFLPHVCRHWEAGTTPASDAGMRVVHIRTGIVLSTLGGSLRPQLPLFKLGLGAQLGDGKQWMSWISLKDEVAAICHLIQESSIFGPVNLVTPSPVTNAEFTSTLASVLGRLAILRIPASLLRLVLGSELANELLLTSQRVEPAVLEASGFKWEHPELRSALQEIIRR